MDAFDKDKPPSEPASPADRAQSASAEVGYGKPPIERRFKPGRSGNPRGRRRGSKNRKMIVRAIAGEVHTVREDGRALRRTTLELVLLSLRNLVLEGNVRAFHFYSDTLAKYEPQSPSAKLACAVFPSPISQEEWIAKQEELNKTRMASPGYDP